MPAPFSLAEAFHSARRGERQFQPRQPDVALHVASAVAAGGVVENRPAIADFDHAGQTDAFRGPCAIRAIEDDGLVLCVPFVEVLGPIDPDGIREFTAGKADVVGKEFACGVAAPTEDENGRCGKLAAEPTDGGRTLFGVAEPAKEFGPGRACEPQIASLNA